MTRHLFKATILLTALLVSGCSIPTPSYQDSGRQVNPNLVKAHQDKIKSFNDWSMSGRLALIQKERDERDSLYINWQQKPSYQELRFSHPFKGQLAKLTIDSQQATLVDSKGTKRSALDASTLLTDLFQVSIPFNQLHRWLVGEKTAQLEALTYYNDGTLASASIIQQNRLWKIQWFYNSSSSNKLTLPEQIHIESSTLKIKVQMQEWQHN